MEKSTWLSELVENQQTRRGFAKRLGAISAGLAGTTLLGGSIVNAVAQSTGTNPASSTVTDTDILNFALNLEYLEAEFYTFATDGASITQEGVIPGAAVSGPTTGGHKVPNIANSPVAYIASALRHDEQAHVKFLRGALGSAAVNKPAINLNALGIGFGSWQEFLVLGRAFEDVGVSAYGGAAGLIQNKTYLEAAARIAETESMHSGSIREYLINNGIAVKPVDSLDVVPTAAHPYFVDQFALAIPRSTSQVLHIVYAGGTTSGGFFPKGFNGTIR